MKELKKHLLIITSIILLLAYSCKDDKTNNKKIETSVKENVNKNNYKIDSKNAGDFYVGKEMPNKVGNFKVEKKSKKIIEEGVEFIENYYQISDKNENLMTCILDGEKGQEKIIREILISSPKFKTNKNIGINSSIEAFVRAYPDFKIWFSYISKRFVLQNKSMEVQFLLNSDDYIGNNEKLYETDLVNLMKEDFKENSKITKIRLFNFED